MVCNGNIAIRECTKIQSEIYLKLYEVWCAASSVGSEVAAAAMRDLRRVWPDFRAVADEVASYWAAIFNSYAALSSNARIAIRNSYHRVIAVAQEGFENIEAIGERVIEQGRKVYYSASESVEKWEQDVAEAVRSWFHSNGRNKVTSSTSGKQRVEALIDYVYNSIPPFWLSLKTFTLARVHQISHDVVAFWNLFKNYQFTQDALFLFRRCHNGIYSMNYSEVIQSVVSAALGQHYELRVRNSSVLLSVTLKRPASSLAAAAHLVFPARTSLPKLLVTALPANEPMMNYTIVLGETFFQNVLGTTEILPISGCEYILSRHHVPKGAKTTWNMAVKGRIVTRRQNPQSIMAWAAVTASRRSPLVFVPCGVKLNSERVSQSGPYRPTGSVEEMQRGGRRVRLESGAYITV
ncbi:hypothetical protein FHG87_006944 [Trinorchestia longiramus]|nr:hypothetical protein FHG87_006944 [Trinorchestia longiramus]